MFLKRLFVTALGALGLGALLASGTAFAQQLPAPKVLGSVANCQGTARTAQGSPGRNENRSPLDIILTGGDATDPAGSPIARNSADADITDAQETQLLGRLTIDLTATPCDTNPVAGGYQRAIDLYNDYISAKDALPREDDDPNEESNLERAARLALADKNAFGGDVYTKVYDLLMQEKAVMDTIDDYNALVGDDGRLFALQTAYEAISIAITTDNDGDSLDTDGLERLYGEDEIQGYQAIESTAFNELGQLQLEDTASTGITTLGGIVGELQTRQTALDTATRNLDNAREAGNLNLAALQEAERRAKVARDHVQDELNRLTAIVRAQNRPYADTATIITGTRGGDDEVVLARNHRQVLSGFQQIGGEVDKAQEAVVDAVKDLDTANKDARDALGNAKDYLNQLVTLREYDQAKAQEAHDEVTNPAPALVSDLDDAKMDTMAAKDLRKTYQDLTGDSEDPTPANELVDALLKPTELANGSPNPEDDDGLAVVQAVTKTYDATQSNEDRLDALLTTADDGTESGRVKALEDKVTMLEGDDTGGLNQLRTDLDALTAMDDPETMEDETGEVTQNAADISRVDGELTKLELEVDDNSDDLDQVWMDLNGTPRGVEAQHEGLAACEATGTINVANCADARSRHNEEDIGEINTDLDDVKDKLGLKKEYIENLGEAIGVDPVTGEGTGEDGMSRVDMNAKAIADEAETRMAEDGKLGDRITNLAGDGRTDETVMGNAKAIADEAETRMAEDGKLGDRITNLAGDGRTDETVMGNAKAIADEAETRMAEDGKLGDRIDKEAEARMAEDGKLGDRITNLAGDGRTDETVMGNAKAIADEAETRMAEDGKLGDRIDKEAEARMDADKTEMDARMMADDALGGRIDKEAMARADGDVMLATAIEEAVAAGAAADMALGGRISSNADAIASNMNSIGQNRSMINDNRNMIGELSDDLDVVRAGVAASMALAGMPAINGRGIAIGVGSYDGESAFAVGFQIQGEQASFKVGVTSSGGETGASAGVGFNF